MEQNSQYSPLIDHCITSEKKSGVKSWGNAGEEEHEPFPTLELILDRLDSSCGFNIEIKYPGMMKTGKMEDEGCNPMEMNLFLDQILKTVLTHGKERKILFSSFNPDICTMWVITHEEF